MKYANFDTYSYSGSSMVSFLNSVASGDVVVVAAKDATENWKDEGHISYDLKMVNLTPPDSILIVMNGAKPNRGS